MAAALRDADLIECEEEGRVMYLTTWCIHHRLQPHCYEGRAVRLDDEPDRWADELLAPWTAEIVPDQPVTIRVVRPTPPCGRFECVQAHVIIEQADQDQALSLLISICDPDEELQHWAHRAYSADRLQNVPSLLRLTELQVRCQNIGCVVMWRGLPLAIVDF